MEGGREGGREGGSVWGGERVKQLAGGGQWCVTCGVLLVAFGFTIVLVHCCFVRCQLVLCCCLVLSLIY